MSNLRFAPGFVRVDSVHQGDLDGRKGVYEINLVDEVTQYEFVGATEAISERFLIPVLEGLLGLFPFAIKGFHADNGSEYVNHAVAALLELCERSLAYDLLHTRNHGASTVRAIPAVTIARCGCFIKVCRELRVFR